MTQGAGSKWARLGEHWPAVLTVEEAALYAGFSAPSLFLRVPQYAETVRVLPEGKRVLRSELEEAITARIGRASAITAI